MLQLSLLNFNRFRLDFFAILTMGGTQHYKVIALYSSKGKTCVYYSAAYKSHQAHDRRRFAVLESQLTSMS